MKKTYLLLILIIISICNQVLASNWRAKWDKAEDYYNLGEYQSAIILYQEIAENLAYESAQFKLAWIYSNGLGVKKNSYEALRWYTLAASQGNFAAQNNLYILYINGSDDFLPNKSKAIFWLKRSAKNGNSRAQANLSYLYSEGIEVEKDEIKAFELANKSSNQGDDLGRYYLALYYYNGIGISVNIIKAFNLMKKVAYSKNKNDDNKTTIANAQNILGNMYMDGKGTPKNWEKAYEWYLISHGNGFSGNEKIIKDLEQKLNKEQIYKSQQSAKYWMPGGSTLIEDRLKWATDAIFDEKYSLAYDLIQGVDSSDARYIWIQGRLYKNKKSKAYQSKGIDMIKQACYLDNWNACADVVGILIESGDIKAAKKLVLTIDNKTPKRKREKLIQSYNLLKLNFFQNAYNHVMSLNEIDFDVKNLTKEIRLKYSKYKDGENKRKKERQKILKQQYGR